MHYFDQINILSKQLVLNKIYKWMFENFICNNYIKHNNVISTYIRILNVVHDIHKQ